MASLTAPNPGLPRPTRAWTQNQALVALMDRRLQSRWGAKIGRLGAAWVCLGYIVAMVVAHRSGRPSLVDALVVAALGALSWAAAGPTALAIAGSSSSAERAERADGFEQLAALRGYDASALGFAQFSAAIRRVRRVTLWPALLVAGVALSLSTSGRLLMGRLLLVAGAVTYTLVLSFVAGIVARGIGMLSPTHGRGWLLVVVIAPHLLHLVWPEVASIPSGFAWLLDQLPHGAVSP